MDINDIQLTARGEKILDTIVAKYMDFLEDLTDEELYLCLSLLHPLENSRFRDFEKALGDNLTRARIYLFICNEIDFYEDYEEKVLHDEAKKERRKAKIKLKSKPKKFN